MRLEKTGGSSEPGRRPSGRHTESRCQRRMLSIQRIKTAEKLGELTSEPNEGKPTHSVDRDTWRYATGIPRAGLARSQLGTHAAPTTVAQSSPGLPT